MLVSNFGVGIIYCFLNLLFYSIDNRNNEKLDQFTPLEIKVYKQNKTCFGSNIASGYRHASMCELNRLITSYTISRVLTCRTGSSKPCYSRFYGMSFTARWFSYHTLIGIRFRVVSVATRTENKQNFPPSHSLGEVSFQKKQQCIALLKKKNA